MNTMLAPKKQGPTGTGVAFKQKGGKMVKCVCVCMCVLCREQLTYCNPKHKKIAPASDSNTLVSLLVSLFVSLFVCLLISQLVS